MGPLGWQETVFIFLLALLVFGPRKLPELGKTVGKALTEFRRASSELKSTFDREMKSLERENESLKEVARSYYDDTVKEATPTYNYDTESYDYPPTDESTVSASASEGAESTTIEAPEGAADTTTENAGQAQFGDEPADHSPDTGVNSSVAEKVAEETTSESRAVTT